MTSYNW